MCLDWEDILNEGWNPLFSKAGLINEMTRDHEAGVLKVFFDHMISGKDKDRGQGFTIEGSYKFTPHIAGLLKYEHFDPGNFYVPEAGTRNS